MEYGLPLEELDSTELHGDLQSMDCQPLMEKVAPTKVPELVVMRSCVKLTDAATDEDEAYTRGFDGSPTRTC